MDSNTITALATGLLVAVGIAQIGILKSQRRHSQLELTEVYRRRWENSKQDWGTVIFIGRDEDEYYQVISKEVVDQLASKRDMANNHEPTVWALDATRSVFGNMSDICTRILQNQLDIEDVYSLFGTELLRQSRPLRVLLDNNYPTDSFGNSNAHHKVRNEVQDWLIYHDGIRRRCLILIDLLWAEAARLEDLPPSDLKSAAEAKIHTGKNNRTRLLNECNRLNRSRFSFQALKLSKILRNSEYQKCCSRIGINKKRLEKLEKEWTDRLLHNFHS